MGKKPLLGLVGACWLGLASNGCQNSQTRTNGQRFHPAPLVQTKPAANKDVAATGFQSPPKSTTTVTTPAPIAPDAIKPAPLPNTAVPGPTDPLTSGKPIASPVQQTGAGLQPTETMPQVPPVPQTTGSYRGFDDRNTTRKTTPAESSIPEAPVPPASALPSLSGTLLPLPGTTTPALPAPPRNNVTPIPAMGDLANEPPPVSRPTVAPLPSLSPASNSVIPPAPMPQ